MEGALRLCRICKTAFSDAFPRLHCQCGQNDDGAAEKAPTPSPDYAMPDPFEYDFAPGAPDPPPTPRGPTTPPELQTWWL
ncbi:MAG: hypothetical protein HY689_00370 [Chloroflexi bacterium]|nr:hypothetical protein [Chloroflexota bacterium]